MKPQEAIEIFNDIDWFLSPCDEVQEQEEEAVKLAIQALEKQVPKRILRMRGNPLILDCPTCETSLYNYENDKHCYDCGQAIDWSTDEN